jgi:hypothetical protein
VITKSCDYDGTNNDITNMSSDDDITMGIGLSSTIHENGKLQDKILIFANLVNHLFIVGYE